MFITPGFSDCSEIHISFDSVKLNTVLSTKLLGVMIDNKLLWDEHVSFIISKVAKKIGALHRARRSLSLPARKLFLLSVILPGFDCCCSVFACGVFVCDRKRLEALERRAVRICAGAGYMDDCDPLYASLNIAPLQERWLLRVLNAVFSAVKGIKPPAVQDIFCLSGSTSNDHYTRSKSSLGVLPRRADA